jgi:hypothetical protein
MATKQVSFDIKRLILEVATRHNILLKPDDAAFAIVTMNRLVLEESLEAIHARVTEDLALFQTAAQNAQSRAESDLATEVRVSAAAIRREIQRDIQTATLEAAQVVRQVTVVYEQAMSRQKFAIVVLAAVLLFFLGALAGRTSALWWPV